METIAILITMLFILFVMVYVPYKIYKLFTNNKNPINSSATDWKCPKCGLFNNLKGASKCLCGYSSTSSINNNIEVSVMICDFCSKTIYSYNKINDNSVCADCYDKVTTCIKCNDLVKKDTTLSYNGLCDKCINIKYDIDSRIAKLMKEPINTTMHRHTGNITFNELSNEALSEANIINCYRIIGAEPDEPFNQIQEKCKELLRIWHPSLHKGDGEQHIIAENKFVEIKRANDAIEKELEKPFKVLELKYGSSQKEIIESYEKLKKIYDPNNFKDNPKVRYRVELKFNEIKNAFNELTQHKKQVNPASSGLNNVKTITSLHDHVRAINSLSRSKVSEVMPINNTPVEFQIKPVSNHVTNDKTLNILVNHEHLELANSKTMNQGSIFYSTNGELKQVLSEGRATMKKSTKLRMIGGGILLFNFWLIGEYNFGSIPTVLLTFGFAVGFESLVVRPASRVAEK